MQQNSRKIEETIDLFIYSNYAQESPSYLAIMRARLLDLCMRAIPEESAAAYLKSAGWGAEFADYYKQFLEFVRSRVTPVEEKSEVKSEDSVDPTFTKAQVTRLLLRELIVQLASHTDFRSLQEDEDIHQYRKDFEQYLDSRAASSMSDVGKSQLVMHLDKINELSSLCKTYLQQLD